MTKEREYRWYLEPLDAHTNEVLARNVGIAEEIGEYSTTEGSKHLYLVDREVIRYVKQSQTTLHICFQIYVQEGSGQIRLSKFVDGKKRRLKRWPRRAKS
ncbi:MAG: hypothetical protein PHW95_01135 [Patescibacteria group bacterium]|nr:hypothetical protein [Patescibacteria group bacterium]